MHKLLTDKFGEIPGVVFLNYWDQPTLFAQHFQHPSSSGIQRYVQIAIRGCDLLEQRIGLDWSSCLHWERIYEETCQDRIVDKQSGCLNIENAFFAGTEGSPSSMIVYDEIKPDKLYVRVKGGQQWQLLSSVVDINTVVTYESHELEEQQPIFPD
ncbi:MAG: hypothetical protein ACKN9T_00705 [Candidatus Methylumidiphilus sp.]